MIKADNLVKTFVKTGKKNIKHEFNAVDGISISADSGEIVGILGPNGAGKTTLLRMMGKLMEPTGGTVTVTDDNDGVISDEIEIKKRIGYLSGNTRLYKRMSAREMLLMLAQMYEIDIKDAKRRIEEISEILNLNDFLDNRIERLSTGQTQRVGIARCLIHNPKAYIFDEPTLGLDILSSRSIIEFMKKEKAAGKTVLYSTHYMEEAEFLCDRIYMIHNGKVVATGTPAELKEQTGTGNLRDTFLSIIEEGSDENREN